MKNFFKILVGLSLIALNIQASTLTTNIVGAGTNVIVAKPCRIAQIYAVNSGTQAVTLTIFDTGSNTVTQNLASYTNNPATVVSVTNIYTDYRGVSVTNTYYAITNTATTVVATSNTFPVLLTFTVPTNNTITFTPYTAVTANRGLLVTNKDSITVFIDYLPTY